MDVIPVLFLINGFLAVCQLLAFISMTRENAKMRGALQEIRLQTELRVKDLEKENNTLMNKVLVIETRLEERAAQAERAQFKFMSFEDHAPRAVPLSTPEFLEQIKRGPGRPPGAKNKQKAPEILQETV